MNIDQKIEIIRQTLENHYGYCSVNRGPKYTTFFYGTSENIIVHQKASIPKEFMEALPLVGFDPLDFSALGIGRPR